MKYRLELKPLDLSLLNKLEEMVFGESRVNGEKLALIARKSFLFLIVYDGNRPIGFKLGYYIRDIQKFFSWLGGVDRQYRGQGIATNLIEIQEKWCQEKGYKTVYFTSFERFPEMISLGQKQGYGCVKSALDDGEMKYWFEKILPEND
jgi:GNAT superfamily N-acetyltransferase